MMTHQQWMERFKAQKMAANNVISYATILRQANFGRKFLSIVAATRPKRAI